jgi:hypothetical protein
MHIEDCAKNRSRTRMGRGLNGVHFYIAPGDGDIKSVEQKRGIMQDQAG